MISIEKYNRMEISKKADILWNAGKYFDERIDYRKYQYKYYYMSDFIVEVRYNFKENRIDNIEAMEYFSNDNTTLKDDAI